MITGAHLQFNSRDAATDRAFLTEVLGWHSVGAKPAQDGWLVFRMPPTEFAIHPAVDPTVDLLLTCEDIATTVADLWARGVNTGPVTDKGYGFCTRVRLPSGAEVGLYEPRHTNGLKV